MIKRAMLFAAVFFMAYTAFSAIIAHPSSPTWTVQHVACTAAGGCLKGENNPVDCAGIDPPEPARQVLVSADTALRLHTGDPCPTAP
jgi:hypothetical protein